MSSLLSYLPPAEGLLPKWLLLIGVISIGNSIQSYSTLFYTARVYNPSPIDPPPVTPKHVTELTSRVFGTWTMMVSIVRLYAAYNINNPQFYQLALCTYIIAFVHFGLEWLHYKTTRWGKPLAGPIIISSVSLLWMLLQWDYYVRA